MNTTIKVRLVKFWICTNMASGHLCRRGWGYGSYSDVEK